MRGLICRRASAEDAGHLATLHALCFEAPWDTASFVRLLSRPGALGLLGKRQETCAPVAFVLFDHVGEEAEILTLGVHPACRKRSVAASLLAKGFEELAGSGARRLFLEVAADNMPALALYRSTGFTVSGRRSGYYRRNSGPPADALVLARFLEPSGS